MHPSGRPARSKVGLATIPSGCGDLRSCPQLKPNRSDSLRCAQAAGPCAVAVDNENDCLVVVEQNNHRVHWLTKEDNKTARILYDQVADRSGFIQYRKIL